MTILSAGSVRRERPATVDEMAVGHVLPVGVVVVGFAGQHDAVGVGAAPTGCRPTWWRSSREPLAARMFSRALGSAAATSTMVSPSASRPRSKISAASSALSTVDSAADDERQHRAVDQPVVRQQPLPVGERAPTPTVRSACRRWPSAPPPPRSRCAARAPPRRTTRHPTAGRRCANVVRTSPVEEPDAPAVGVHQAVLLPARRIRLHQKAVRRIEHQRRERARLTEPAQMTAHQARPRPAARREKICRRIGWSQLRKLGRRMLARHRPRPAAQHLVVAPDSKNGCEYCS